MANWGEAGKDAAAGAATGALVAGPWGAAIGGGIGGLYGLFGGGGALNRGKNEFRNPGSPRDYYLPSYGGQYNTYSNLSRQYASRYAPQAQTSTFRTGQQSLGNMLLREAQGRGVGQQIVRQQAQDAADRGMAQQLAMAQSARPGMQAMAARNAAFNSGALQSNVGGQASLAGGQMALGAQSQYGNFLQGARGQDEALSQFNADAKLRQMGLNDQSQLEALRQRLAAAQSQQLGQFNYQQQRGSRFNALLGTPTQGEQELGALMGALQIGANYRRGSRQG